MPGHSTPNLEVNKAGTPPLAPRPTPKSLYHDGQPSWSYPSTVVLSGYKPVKDTEIQNLSLSVRLKVQVSRQSAESYTVYAARVNHPSGVFEMVPMFKGTKPLDDNGESRVELMKYDSKKELNRGDFSRATFDWYVSTSTFKVNQSDSLETHYLLLPRSTDGRKSDELARPDGRRRHTGKQPMRPAGFGVAPAVIASHSLSRRPPDGTPPITPGTTRATTAGGTVARSVGDETLGGWKSKSGRPSWLGQLFPNTFTDDGKQKGV